MSRPERVQLRRTKGWRKPDNTVVVSRPSKWGNPFPVLNGDAERATATYRRFVTDPTAMPGALDLIRTELGGKNLACWCPLTSPCHADVLLDLANPEAAS